jgi:putative ABC transport system permease protein
VVLQFAISIGLGVAAIVVFQQISYAQKVNLGFNRNNVIAVEGADKLTQAKRDSVVQALNGDPAIESAAQFGPSPFSDQPMITNVQPQGAPQSSILRVQGVGFGFYQLYRMHMLAGRPLTISHANDANAPSATSGVEEGHNILINAAAARHFGLTPAEAVGKIFLVGRAHVNVVGVLADANMDGVQTVVPPLIYYNNPNTIQSISVRARPGRDAEALEAVDRIWHRFAPGLAIQRHFLDDSFNGLFAADQQEGVMFGLFVCIAIFIACLGLFGLAAFTAERRTKEIGIRKAFGARTRDIVRLLLWQFSIPVLIANVIAWPVAWYYLHHWLESYAYRIALSPFYFVAAGSVALIIAWATVIAHAVRIARSNPINALRYE